MLGDLIAAGFIIQWVNDIFLVFQSDEYLDALDLEMFYIVKLSLRKATFIASEVSFCRRTALK